MGAHILCIVSSLDQAFGTNMISETPRIARKKTYSSSEHIIKDSIHRSKEHILEPTDGSHRTNIPPNCPSIARGDRPEAMHLKS